MRIATFLTVLLAATLISCTWQSSTNGGLSDLGDLVNNLPTKETLKNLANGSRSSTRTIKNASFLDTSSLNYEMDYSYSLLATNDICKAILSTVSNENKVDTLNLGTITLNAQTLNNVVLKYDLTGDEYRIDLKYECDQYSQRFVLIKIIYYGTANEMIYVSCFDKITNPIPSFADYEYVNRCNFVFTKADSQFKYFCLYSSKGPTDIDFRKYATLFRSCTEEGKTKFYRSNNDVYENYEYLGQTYPEFIWETEREFAFLSPADGYGGKSYGTKMGAGVYQFYDENFDLIYFYTKSIDENSPDCMRLYFWPVRFIYSVNSEDVVLYDDSVWRVWIDTNTNGVWDGAEPRLQTDIEANSQVCPSNVGIEKSIPIFASYVTYTVPSENVGFNYYSNPAFSGFTFIRSAFLSTNRGSISTFLNTGLAQDDRFDPINFPTNQNPENVDW